MSEKRQRGDQALSRYTPEEWGMVSARAASAGLSVGQYQRALALSDAGLVLPAVRRRPLPEMDELRRLLGQIGKLGSNVNQIAAVMNAGRDVPPDLADALRAVAEMRDLVARAMGARDP